MGGELIFSRATRYIAFLILIISVSRIVIGFSIAAGVIGPAQVLGPRYLGNASVGAAIDQGFYGVAIALILGTLSEIAITLQRSRM